MAGDHPRRRILLGVAVVVAGGVCGPATAGVAPPTFRHHVETKHPCLAAIIRAESGWDVTVDYGGGHGNVYESYGLGQANPGTKMAAYGRDFATNPWTQLRWIRAYAIGRYGSECGAWSFWQTHHYW